MRILPFSVYVYLRNPHAMMSNSLFVVGVHRTRSDRTTRAIQYTNAYLYVQLHAYTRRGILGLERCARALCIQVQMCLSIVQASHVIANC